MSALPNITETQSLPKPIFGVETQAKVQTGLLVMTVGCAALALVPPFRIVGSLVGRSLAFLSRSIQIDSEFSKQKLNNWKKAFEVSKLGVIVLGIVAVAAVSPVLVLASLVADAGMQAIELVKALYKGDKTKALMHLGLLAIDTLVIIAIAAASWKLMVAAAAVSAFVLVALAAKLAYSAKSKREFIDTMCYLGLAALGITSAVQVQVAEVTKQVPVKAHFTVKNSKDSFMYVYCQKKDKWGEVQFVNPVKSQNTQHFYLDIDNTCDGKAVLIEEWLINDRFNEPLQFYVKADAFTYNTVVVRPSLNPIVFPTLPVGTHVINSSAVTQTPTNTLKYSTTNPALAEPLIVEEA